MVMWPRYSKQNFNATTQGGSRIKFQLDRPSEFREDDGQTLDHAYTISLLELTM